MIDPQHENKRLEVVKSIQKKLLGKTLNYKEVYGLMDEIAHDHLGDVLTTYFVASSFKEGFTADELYYFTKAMVETGTKLKFKGIVADKHSTGGIAGTRTTMILVPIIASAGFLIPKTSSRAITSPAGTADVMEVLASVTFTPKQIDRIVNDIGGCIVWGGKLGIAPADDVIIDVEEELSFESYDKVIMSIMAKKIAVSTNHLVLDIPIGRTMKIKYRTDGEKVAKKFTALAKRFGIKTVIDINESTQPYGNGVGPILEARDVLQILEQGKDRALPLEEKALRLSGKLLDICYQEKGVKKNGSEEAKRLLTSGAALKKFREIIKAQGGDEKVSCEELIPAIHHKELLSTRRGTIEAVNNYHLNTAAKVLGAPHEQNAGIMMLKRVGEKIDKNEPYMRLYGASMHHVKEALETILHFPIYEIKS